MEHFCNSQIYDRFKDEYKDSMGKYPQLATILFLMENGCNLNAFNHRGMKAVDISNEAVVTTFLEVHAQEFQSDVLEVIDFPSPHASTALDNNTTSGTFSTEENNRELCIFCPAFSIVIEFPNCGDYTDVFCSVKCASRIPKCLTCRRPLVWSPMNGSSDDSIATRNSYEKSKVQMRPPFDVNVMASHSTDDSSINGYVQSILALLK